PEFGEPLRGWFDVGRQPGDRLLVEAVARRQVPEGGVAGDDDVARAPRESAAVGGVEVGEPTIERRGVGLEAGRIRRGRVGESPLDLVDDPSVQDRVEPDVWI